jgi:hypothetical protein
VTAEVVLERVEPHFASPNVLGYQLSDNAPFNIKYRDTKPKTLLAPRGELVISSHFTPFTTRAGLSRAHVGATIHHEPCICTCPAENLGMRRTPTRRGKQSTRRLRLGGRSAKK